MKKIFKEKFLKTIFIRKGKAVSFKIDSVRLQNGKKAIREYLDHPGAVAIVPLLNDGRIVMVKQYRHPVQEITFEVPAGKLDKNEPLLNCAKRELQEETGYIPKKIKKILSFWPTAAFANEIIHIYLAENLIPGPENPDEDEFINVEKWTLKKALSAVRSGEIKDSKTIIAILAYSQFVKKS